jgi:SET and MYND domain-containing protein
MKKVSSYTLSEITPTTYFKTMNCYACGLPPILNQTLQRCSRCKNAWYHDVECQKQHYSRHKKECQSISAAAAADTYQRPTAVPVTNLMVAANSSSNRKTNSEVNSESLIEFECRSDDEIRHKIEYKHPLVECEIIDGKGRSLMATSDMYIGCHPLNPSNKDVNSAGYCEPLVPPVLMESERKSRCAYCFQKFDASYHPTHYESLTGCTIPSRLLHYHCSKQCRDKDENHKAEGNAIQMINQIKWEEFQGEYPSPTVILCSRILRYSSKTPSIAASFEELCFNTGDLSQEDKDHFLKVMIQCSLFLRYTKHHITGSIDKAAFERACGMVSDPTLAYIFMSRIVMNGFTVSTSEQMGIGIGIYPRASMINHSCRPNAVQSFYFFHHSCNKEPNVPMLQITTCQEVKAGEEVTISYCDVSAPRHLRRKELFEGYKFDCDCHWCANIDNDMKVVGLKCPDSNCGGKVVCLQTGNVNLPSNHTDHPQYKCSSCGYSKYAETLAELVQNVRNAEKSQHEAYSSDIVKIDQCGTHLMKTYDFFKMICNNKSSWYIAWCGDAIVNWSINSIGLYNDERQQEKICIRALQVIDESRSAMLCFKYAGGLKWYILEGIEAKLRLFINPNDIDAFYLLWDVKRYLSLFVDADSDELVKSLDDSISTYSYIKNFDKTDPLESIFCSLSHDEVRTLWITNGCKDYRTEVGKNTGRFLCGHLEQKKG